MPSLRSHARLVLGLLALTSSAAAAQQKELPVKYSGPPTAPGITAGDLMTRLYIYADDSLMGRQVGTEYNLRATAWIEREVRRMGLVPAGENGGYFQDIPYFARVADTSSTITVNGTTWRIGEFLVSGGTGTLRPLTSGEVIYGGTALDTTNLLTPEQVRGRIVVLRPLMTPPANARAFAATNGYKQYVAALGAAQGVIALVPGAPSPAQLRSNTNAAFARGFIRRDSAPEQPMTIQLPMALAANLFDRPLDSLAKGAVGRTLAANVRFTDVRKPGRNVVAILTGGDAALKGQYVAIGAHNDHVGFNTRPVDHDSLRAFNMVARQQGADSPAPTALTPEQTARSKAMTDSLHALHGVRLDSIYNGADDDGSGSVAVLEIAEAFATAKQKPKRSILFVWHTGEEAGLYGSQHYTDHPTVPRDSIVAQLNMDMIGRGGALEVTGEIKGGGLAHGGPGYVQLVGSRRLSTELGDLVEAVNRDLKRGLNFDYSQDANGHPQNIYCRSDHYEYARYGIPVTFFTTGGHSDYHQVTDEPQYIDYARLQQVASFVYDVAWKVANLDHRVVVDKAKPDPKGSCVQ